MKQFDLLAIMLVASAVVCLSSQTAAAASAAETESSSQSTTPGVELAHTTSLITGVGISPLLGTGAVGAWKYFQARTRQQRANLPWFAQPWFWIPALLLASACFLKDTVGIAVPRVVKKPFDAAEVIEHKISGLLATGAFVPLVVPVLQPAASDSTMSGGIAFLAMADPSSLASFILVPAMMIVFFVVSLASSAINILILLSPFRAVDVALKGFRLFILSTVAATALANPWLGAAWALIIIVIAYLVAGWSFRLSHFGLVFIWEWMTQRRKRFTPDKSANRVFLSRTINKAPTRSYGTLLREANGNLVLKYRPWLILPERRLTLPQGKYFVGKGLLYSEIMRSEGENARTAILLPPRYRSHEQELVAIYGLTEVRDTGVRAAFLWLKELVGFKPKQQAAGP
jgi:hypothetical protein